MRCRYPSRSSDEEIREDLRSDFKVKRLASFPKPISKFLWIVHFAARKVLTWFQEVLSPYTNPNVSGWPRTQAVELYHAVNRCHPQLDDSTYKAPPESLRRQPCNLDGFQSCFSVISPRKGLNSHGLLSCSSFTWEVTEGRDGSQNSAYFSRHLS